MNIRGQVLVSQRWARLVLILGLLFAATTLGLRPSMRWVVLPVLGVGAFVVLRLPQLGLLSVIVAALIVPFELSTGTEVKLNLATVLVPLLFALWFVEGVFRRDFQWKASPVNKPLTFFLLAGLLSLLVGNALWDPAVPRSGNFVLVQLAQWAIFAFAALAFWLVANLREPEVWLPRLTWAFLYLGGGLAILRMLPGVASLAERVTTVTFIRAPFWVLLAAIAGGQLLFEASLSRAKRGFLVASLLAVLTYAFVAQREAVSNWVGVAAVAGVLLWLRFPRARGAVIALAVILAATGILFPSIWEFAGGEDEWTESGGSRLALIERVVSVTLRNPITGLGPASYRNYAGVEPLRYRTALWVNPAVNSHNNYVDLFAHTGLVGLGLFLWFAWELFRLGLGLSARQTEGFTGGYVNGMTAAWVGSLVVMLFADWMLPFVYNIGFPGFQASILVWLFLGGLVAINHKGHEVLKE
ncbi:MAG: O-antigen ligase family protein [Anaerolineae bacterium]|nr:O-antigen ligase family protein [Anaerolineae bacterium]